MDLVLEGNRVCFAHSWHPLGGDTRASTGGKDYRTAVYKGDTWTTHDSARGIKQIEASSGRKVIYEYDLAGCLSRVADSEGHAMAYTYDRKAQMLSISRGTKPPAPINK